ncbi:hypothetical protein [Streptomyces sp. SAI-127]|uniref:hypothetical protein n=1 Tax=Streptomyces sp. SAI-127 TaxID=2940543 RepID=UPI002476A414|nr:hypothetical protein [Streptomyces sp. SAI-127]MDH6489593.1 hypothetical protein [Streptomyces sp. SAI-127]
MTDETETPPVFQLPVERVEEIRDLLAELVAAPRRKATAGDAEHRQTLTRCRDAITDLLNDRDALVKANAEAGQEIAGWRGAL